MFYGKPSKRPAAFTAAFLGTALAALLLGGCVPSDGTDPIGSGTGPVEISPDDLVDGILPLTRLVEHRTIKEAAGLPEDWLAAFASATPELPADPDQRRLLESLLSFSRSSFGLMAENWDEENLLLSPLSLYVDLAMLGEGTAGTTRSEIARALAGDAGTAGRSFADTTGEDQDFIEQNRSALTDLLGGMNMSREKFTMRAGQSLWYRPDLPVRREYLDLLESSYYAEAYFADFAGDPDGVREAIGTWVSDKTAGLLGDDLPLEIKPNDVLYLIQSLYFKDSWLHPFSPDQTEEGTFNLTDGSSRTVPFMKRTALPAWGLDADGYQAAELQTEQGFVFRVILPDEVISLQDALALEGFYETAFSDHLSAASDRDSAWSASFEVHWSVPRFDLKTEADLLDLLRGMGVEEVMSGEADFSLAADVSPGAMFLDTAAQQVRVKVDEKGVEAAAVTILGTATSMPEITGRLEMNLNRPFFFTISTPSGLPLFMGWTGDAASKE